MKLYRVLFLSVLAVLSISTAQAKKVELKYKLNAGQEFVIKHSMKQEIGQEVMGMSQVMENLVVYKYAFKVLEVKSDGNYLLSQQIVMVKMVMENEYINIDYNSEEDEEVPAGLEYLSGTIKIPVKFLMSPRGVILEIVDAEEYLNKIEEALGNTDGMAQQMLSGMASQTASLEGLQMQLGNMFFKYAEGKVKVGKAWEDVSESQQMVSFTNTIQNTVVEVDKESATIKQEVDIEMMEMEEPMEMEGMEMNYELSGRKEAAYNVCVATGLVISVQAVTDISGVISIDSPQLPSPMNMPMTIKLTEDVKLID